MKANQAQEMVKRFRKDLIDEAFKTKKYEDCINKVKIAASEGNTHVLVESIPKKEMEALLFALQSLGYQTMEEQDGRLVISWNAE